MDYLDSRKRLRHTIILYVGYVLIGIAIIIATVVLLYQAYGFGIDKKGTVIQNGLIFVSSQPQPADIFVNDRLEGAKTNTRLSLPAATYKLSIQRTGYQNWTRPITVDGGQVAHYDYPLLIPKTLTSTKIFNYEQTPGVMSQSPDKRWLLIARPAKFGSFDVFDLKNPAKAPTPLTLPASVLTPSTISEGWLPVEWADDNQHLLLQHRFNAKIEYVLLDRQAPLQSLNLSRILGVAPDRLSLIDRKYDQYYAYVSASKTLSQATLKSPNLSLVLSGVINYQSYGSDVVLYTSSVGASSGQVRVQLKVGDHGYSIRSVAADSTYLLDITKYNDTFYVVVGASSENKVYIYRDPAAQIGSDVFRSPALTQVLHVNHPDFVGFSSNAQYIVAENGSQFSVYDIENKHGFKYTAAQPLDAPQLHASWMDGDRLTYVSGGKQVIFDYDYQNVRELGKALPVFKPVFAPNYKYSYTINGIATPGAPETPLSLSQTALVIPADL